jgi:galactokinase/mevalonate kinase-like predicted kinase
MNDLSLTFGSQSEEHEKILHALREIMSWNSFAQSLVEQIINKGSLSEKQMFAASAMLMKIKNNKEERQRNIVSIDLSNVKKIFDKAHEAIKNPKFRVDNMVLSRAPDNGRNAGAIYVKVDGEYAGKVTGGYWLPFKAPEGTLEKLQEIAKDPLGSAVAYGKRTGNCSACGRDLTNHGSIEKGIGPICAERWGL